MLYGLWQMKQISLYLYTTMPLQGMVSNGLWQMKQISLYL